MARKSRKYSKSKIYHIIFKGIDNQEIFYDDNDRKYFLKQIIETKTITEYDIYAYCLMGNHVHFVIKIEDEYLSKVVKSILIRYVFYFNKKYDRVGPLVQDRFKSKNVENLKYFLEVCRYIHRNPEMARIAETSEYKWSSYQEYIGKQTIINKSVLLHYFNNDIKSFIKYTNKIYEIEDTIKFSEYEMLGKLKDEELKKFIIKKYNILSEDNIVSFFNKKTINEKRKYAGELKKISGTNITQLSRITRLSRGLFKG